jgi:hypothetical protein
VCLDAIASAPLLPFPLPEEDKQVNLLHLHPVVRPNAMPIRYSIVKEPKVLLLFRAGSLQSNYLYSVQQMFEFD